MSKSIFDENTKLRLSYLEDYPRASKPLPTGRDYKNGWFYRYFARKVNEKSIIEISKSEYLKYKNNPFILTVMVKWFILGIVSDNTSDSVNNRNKREIEKGMKMIDNLPDYVVSYTEYHK